MEDIFSRIDISKKKTDVDTRQCPNGHGLMMVSKSHGYICKSCGIIVDSVHEEHQDTTINNTHNTYANSGAKIVLVGNKGMRKDLFKNTSNIYSHTQKRNSQITIDKALYNNTDVPTHVGKSANEMFHRIVQYDRNQSGKDNIYDDQYDINTISSTCTTPKLSKEFLDDDQITISSSIVDHMGTKTKTYKDAKQEAIIKKLGLTSSIDEEEYTKMDSVTRTGTWRTKVRLGIICACIHYECIRHGMKRPQSIILNIFGGIESKYFIRGCKLLRRYHELGVISLPEEEDNESKSFIQRYISKLNITGTEIELDNYKNFIYNMLLVIDKYNIMGETSSKTSTRCAGIIYILMKSLPQFQQQYNNTEFAIICDNKAFSSIKTFIEIIQPYITDGHFKPLFDQFDIPYSNTKIIKDRVKKQSKKQ